MIDADGRPAANCLDVIAGGDLFGDPVVGSVQIQVRMMNRDDPRPFPQRGRLVNALGQTLVRLQDLEFRVPISAIQCARRFTKSVGLGGNGQFSRCPRWTRWPTPTASRGRVPCSRTTSSACT